MRKVIRFLGATFVALICTSTSATQSSAGVGTDIAKVSEFCLYPDCGARLASTAHEWGFANAATLTEIFDLDAGNLVLVGGSYYNLHAGAVDGSLYSGTVTATYEPLVFQLNYVAANAAGGPEGLPGLDLDFDTKRLRVSLALDLERSVGLNGLSIGVTAVLPSSENDLGISTQIPDFGRLDLVRAHEEPGYDLTVGVLYETGQRDWFRVGATLNVASYDSTAAVLDPNSGQVFEFDTTSNIWFGRIGTTVHPFIPMGVASSDSSWDEWRRKVEVSADLRVANISISGEDTIRPVDAFVGVDVPLLPRHRNPLSKWVEFVGIAGVGTDGSWGVGLGVYGQGKLQWLTCDSMYNRQPGGDLANNFVISGVGCSASFPLPF